MPPLLVALWLASASNAIGLAVSAPKTELSIGEPVKLVLRWHVARRVDVRLDDEAFGLRFLQVRIDGGGGPQRYCEAARMPNEGRTVLAIPRKSRDFTQNVVLLWGRFGSECRVAGDSFPLPKAGTYDLRVSYDDGRRRAESNAVSFTVTEASNRDREILERAGKNPAILWGEDPENRKLLEQYPDSPYLHLVRIKALADRDATLRDRIDPDTGEPLWRVSQVDFDAFYARYHRRVATELLSTTWGAFDEERLELAAVHADLGRDAGMYDRVKRELEQRFPRSQALRRLKELEEGRSVRPPTSPAARGSPC